MTEKQKRNSNFELLRIISIVAIIGYHFYLQTAAYGTNLPVAGAISMFLGSFGRGAVNIFVMIGAWFLIDIRFSAMRMIRLYLTCLMYAVFFTLLVVAFKLPPSPPGGGAALKELLRAFTPFSSSPLWFVSDYLLLLLLTPFLNFFIRELPLRGFRILHWVLVAVFVLIPTIESAIPGFAVYRYYVVKSDMSWMIVLYLLVGYWKRNGCPRMVEGRRAWNTLLGCIGCSALLCIFDRLLPVVNVPQFAVKKFHAFCEFLFMDLASVFCFVLAMSAFFAFRRLTLASSLVNRIASHTLGVYIIHQVPVFIPVMWGIFHVEAWLDSPMFLLWEVLTILAVFSGCTLIDCIGSAVINRMQKLHWVEHLVHKVDQMMNDWSN